MVFSGDGFDESTSGGAGPESVSDGAGKQSKIREVGVDVNAVERMSFVNHCTPARRRQATYGLKSPETFEYGSLVLGVVKVETARSVIKE